MKKRILIVDDEPLIRAALSASFRGDDVSVTAVSCGKDALREIDGNGFNLCFIDIHLPDMNGLEIMKTVKTVSPGTAIVIMTGSEVDAEMQKSIRENAHLLVAKPFDLDRIKTFAGEVLAHGAPPLRAEKDTCDTGVQETFVSGPGENRRRHERYATMHAISCVRAAAEGGQGENRFAASVINISAAGMGIQTDCPLKPGHLLEFSGSALLGTGIVRWSVSAGAAASCRAGVRFVEPRQARADGEWSL